MFSHQSLLKRTLPIVIQCASAHRKPRWLPVAKSKIFRIPKRPVISEEERLELLRINNNYKTQMRAIKRYYHEEMIREKSSLQSATSEMSQALEAEEWQKCIVLNDKWNAQVAAERQERRKQEIEAMEKRALEFMAAKDKEIKQRREKASLEIQREMELSKTFITEENLDEAIDYAINNPIDYNFAIDLQGNKFMGQEPALSKSQERDSRSKSTV